MRLIWIGLISLGMAVLLGACVGVEPGMPEDFALIFAWDTGSLPPEFRYDYVITIGPGAQGEFEYVPGYGDKNSPDFWVKPFAISQENLESLFAYLNAKGILNKKWKTGISTVGGSNTTMIITAFGKDHRVPSISELESGDLALVEAAQDHIRGYVPQSIWHEMEERQAAYEARQSN